MWDNRVRLHMLSISSFMLLVILLVQILIDLAQGSKDIIFGAVGFKISRKLPDQTLAIPYDQFHQDFEQFIGFLLKYV